MIFFYHNGVLKVKWLNISWDEDMNWFPEKSRYRSDWHVGPDYLTDCDWTKLHMFTQNFIKMKAHNLLEGEKS